MTLAGALQCTITTPEQRVFEGDATSVVLPAAAGELCILPRHAPLVGSLGFGELRITAPDGSTRRFFVQGGFLQVYQNAVTVLATSAVDAVDLDPAAEEAELARLQSMVPPAQDDPRALEAHGRQVAVRRSRLRMARKKQQE
ncbi:MAG: ATP synthase F1 subunit epsilon [Planctomycetes bacterium]|nr:ATP synthase F1 subunit epsilon [Planctomycetota bacterium]